MSDKESNPRNIKGCVLVLAIVVIIPVVLVVMMALLGICPPQGSWPTPPWCDSGRLNELPAIFSPVEKEPAAGTPLKVVFEASLPYTTEKVMLNMDGMDFEMIPREGYLFESQEIDCEIGKQINYYYSSGEHKTKTLAGICDSSGKIRAGLAWLDSETYNKPGFVKAHMLMDAGGMVLDPIKNGGMMSTYDDMVSDGAEAMMYLYYWAYDDYQQGTLFNEKEEDTEKYNETWESKELFKKMADGLKSKDMDLILLTVLEWVVTPQEKEGLTWDEYFDLQNGVKWEQGQSWEREMGEKLKNNPNDPEVIEYWDTWFNEYEKFALFAAEISRENNTGYLVLGNQFWGAVNRENEQRWRTLISNVRENYDGKLIQGIWNNEYGPYLEEITWGDELDYIMIGYWNSFVDTQDPSIDELEQAMENYNTEQFDKLYDQTGTPIILFTTFLSKDYGGKNQWTEPLQANNEEVANFNLQARMYEAFFNVTLDEPWFAGVITFGYWVEEDFNPKYSFDKSGSVRNKPAGLVISKWFSQILNE